MKKNILGFLLFCSLFMIINSNVFAQSQAEMLNLANKTYENSNDRLNTIYNKILKNFVNDKSFIENLKKSQTDWIKYRDTQYKVLFSEKNEEFYKFYGSNFGIQSNSYLVDLTENRIAQLKNLIDLKCLYVESKYIHGECSQKSLKEIFK